MDRKDNEQDINPGNRVFEQKLKGNPIVAAEIDKIDAEIISSFDKYKVEELIKSDKDKELMEYVNNILTPLIEKKKAFQNH